MVTSKPYSPFRISGCPLGLKIDSRSDAECPTASPKQTNKRKKSDTENGKQDKIAVRRKELHYCQTRPRAGRGREEIY